MDGAGRKTHVSLTRSTRLVVMSFRDDELSFHTIISQLARQSSQRKRKADSSYDGPIHPHKTTSLQATKHTWATLQPTRTASSLARISSPSCHSPPPCSITTTHHPLVKAHHLCNCAGRAAQAHWQNLSRPWQPSCFRLLPSAAHS